MSLYMGVAEWQEVKSLFPMQQAAGRLIGPPAENNILI